MDKLTLQQRAGCAASKHPPETEEFSTLAKFRARPWPTQHSAEELTTLYSPSQLHRPLPVSPITQQHLPLLLYDERSNEHRMAQGQTYGNPTSPKVPQHSPSPVSSSSPPHPPAASDSQRNSSSPPTSVPSWISFAKDGSDTPLRFRASSTVSRRRLAMINARVCTSAHPSLKFLSASLTTFVSLDAQTHNLQVHEEKSRGVYVKGSSAFYANLDYWCYLD
ncbi:hypothetical protein A4X13_0g9031 [Tilletia indica]|uniref:Uncharacterized protein n=1 Tax=Tilletia indica TaxID=43049 RepID=A0A8T8SBR8_9BASI|nr:hypothetical protein A4X13_0g9031 [Tilletia indica]